MSARAIVSLALATLLGAAAALGPAIGASAPAPERFALVNARVFTGSGEEMEGATIVVAGGKIESVGTAAPPANVPATDVRGRTVIPGLVAALHEVAGNPPGDETIAPDLRALDAIDLYSRNRALLEGGVTTMYVSPGSERLVGGRGAIVKTAGSARVLRETAALQVAFGEGPKRAPAIFEPPIPPSADNPIVPARRQPPTSRASTAATLKFALADAASLRSEIARGDARRDTRLEALFPALARKMPVRVNVHRERDILSALDLAREMGLDIVIEGGTEADRLAPLIAGARVPVILESSARPARTLAGDPAEPGATGRERASAAATLAREGVRLAIVPAAGGNLGDLLLDAGLACRYGLDEKTALRAVTIDAAEILGVADRVGSIAPGKDADLVVLTGTSGPFDLSAAAWAVWVDGQKAYQRTPEAGVLAVRAGRILTGTGEEIRDGVVLVEHGRIVDVGRGGSIPFDAELIDAGDGVVVPGYIDVETPLGLHSATDEERKPEPDSGPASGKTEIALAIDPDDPAFGAALREGVTTVVVSPSGRSAVVGQAAAVKTGGGPGAIYRSPAALRFSALGSVLGAPPSTYERKLRDTLKRGKDYHDRWEKYYKDLEEHEKKKKEEGEKAAAEEAKKEAEKPAAADQPKPAEETPPPKETAPVDPITGRWEGTIAGGPIPQPMPFSADLDHKNGTVAGSLTSPVQGTVPITTGTWDGTTLKLSVTTPMGALEVEAKLDGKDRLAGTWNLAGQASGTLELVRTQAPEGAPVAAAPARRDKKDGPEEPKKDPELEPFRALFKGEIPALVDAAKTDEIEAVLTVFVDEFKVPTVILGGDEAFRIAPDVKRRGPGAGVAAGPEVVQRRPEEDLNLPRVLVRNGIPLAFRSSSARGAEELPLTAAYAVRYGLSSTEALRGLTSGAAKLLLLERRVGAIAPGLDADLVVLSGDPFALTTRVRLVIVGGRVAFDASRSEPW